MCGEKQNEVTAYAEGHKFIHYSTPKTCTTDGKSYDVCSVCHKTFNYTVDKAAGHNFRTITVNPACTKNGMRFDYCLVCEEQQNIEILPASHSWSKWHNVSASGNGIYDAQDAFIVNCIAGGILAREKIGETKYMAADCNHDGAINTIDVMIFEQAGLLLSKVEQSESSEDMAQQQSYLDYLDLIDQTPEKDETPTAAEQSFIEKIISVIRYIISIIRSIIKI